MRIVHLSHTDDGAGAGRAAHRIHSALRESAVESRMLVSQKRTNDPTVEAVLDKSISRFGVRVVEYLEARNAIKITKDDSVFFSPAYFGWFKPAWSKTILESDLVMLYWINGAFIRPEALAKIDKPLIWRLSDVWPFTGGCHYPGSCNGFRKKCGQCPQLHYPNATDNSYRLLKRKRDAWRTLDLTIVAPSRWIANLAQHSSLFCDRPIEIIPTGINLDHYRPVDRIAARMRWGLPQDRLLILFGAVSPTDDPRKGFKQLRQALNIIANSSLASKVTAVTFGHNNILPEDLPIPVISLGYLQEDTTLVAAYNCADVVVVPSLEDNLPNIALEAIACGTPVATFNVCGMPDIVKDGWNGKLASQGDSNSLGQVLIEMLESQEKLMEMRLNARKYAQEHYSMDNQVQAYLKLYQKIITRTSAQYNQ